MPSLTRVPSALVKARSGASMVRDSVPQTHTRPMPCATTAVWLVLPPRPVSTARAAIMPGRSSGLVSRRTRTTFSPRPARRTASAELKTAAPTAAPGDAGMPTASGGSVCVTSNRGDISEVLGQLGGELFRFAAGGEEGAARLGGDGESGGTGRHMRVISARWAPLPPGVRRRPGPGSGAGRRGRCVRCGTVTPSRRGCGDR